MLHTGVHVFIKYNEIHVSRTKIRVLFVFLKSLKDETPLVFSILGVREVRHPQPGVRPIACKSSDTLFASRFLSWVILARRLPSGGVRG